MNRTLLAPFALALALGAIPHARAANDTELAAIREQIRSLRQAYEARIEALEQRLKAAEATASQPAPQVAARPSPAARPNLFNPAISLVLQGNYANLRRDPEKYAIHGFAQGGEIGPGKRGFNLAESEIAMSASVDDKFAGNLIASLTSDEKVSVEEAYGIYTAAPAGLVPKFGRFFSGIGYLNELHPHAWDFHGAPLAYEAFLGGKYVQDGVQMKWIAPIDQFIEIGAEAGSGEGFPGTARSGNGAASAALFAHVGGDVGDSHSWRAGLSWLRARPQDRQWTQADLAGNDALLSFGGTSDVSIADFVWKWAPRGNARATSFKLQGEYVRRRERGDLAYDANGALGLARTGVYESTQSGWYLQGVWQFMPTWRAGLRHDRLSTGTVDYGDNAASLALDGFSPKRTSFMVDWTPSEFSRVRAQYSRSETLPGLPDNQFFVQYILTLGAHGAHRY